MTYKPVPVEERCQEMVPDGGRSVSFHYCYRRSTVIEEGKRWCRQHAPSTLQAKRDAWDVAYEARRAADRERWAREAEEKRRAALYPELLATIEDLLDSLADFKPVDGWHPAIATEQAARKAYEQGLAVIAKAEQEVKP